MVTGPCCLWDCGKAKHIDGEHTVVESAHREATETPRGQRPNKPFTDTLLLTQLPSMQSHLLKVPPPTNSVTGRKPSLLARENLGDRPAPNYNRQGTTKALHDLMYKHMKLTRG